VTGDGSLSQFVLYGVKMEDLLNEKFCEQIPHEIMKKIDYAVIFSLGLL